MSGKPFLTSPSYLVPLAITKVPLPWGTPLSKSPVYFIPAQSIVPPDCALDNMSSTSLAFGLNWSTTTSIVPLAYSKGVSPEESVAFKSAFASISSLTFSGSINIIAKCKGVLPSLFFKLGSAPPSSNAFKTSLLGFFTAYSNGVRPI
ncbi:hypothetical protein D3C77_495830 [compost metagenome]